MTIGGYNIDWSEQQRWGEKQKPSEVKRAINEREAVDAEFTEVLALPKPDDEKVGK